MPLKTIEGSVNVVDAAHQRIMNVFSNGCRVYMAFSAGKDSLCMSHIVYSLIRTGDIDPKQLVVLFIDEEAIYPSMYEMALQWHELFTRVGVEFRWYCLPVKQVCSLNHLQNDESWITWEPGKESEWIRQPPPWAITRSPYLHYPGEMNYQTFCQTITRDGLQMIGLRISESVQRRTSLSKTKLISGNMSGGNKVFPIYDWQDGDVWMYIRDHKLKFPQAYMNLYSVGTDKRHMRLSNFFGIDSCAGLKHIAETDPDLWARIEKREPNAYLTLLYWDSEMFKCSSRRRKELESEGTTKDYRALLEEMLFKNPAKYFTNDSTRFVARQYRAFYIHNVTFMQEHHFRRMYEALNAGDPKLRTLRAMYTSVFGDYTYDARSSMKGGVQK